MPEVIEVKTYSDFLNKKMSGKKITEINIINGRYTKSPFEMYKELVDELPLKVISVNSKGKFIYFTLDKGLWMFNTLGLSGGWFYKENNKFFHPLIKRYINNKDKENDTYIQNAMNHLNVEFKCGNETFYFYDTLSFGTLKVIKDIKHLTKKLNELGPDIMDVKTTDIMLTKNITKKSNLNKEIGNVLMNQKVMAGVGNYLRADALWLSKISPFRKVKDVTDSELKLIFKNLRFLVWSEYNYNKGIKLGFVDPKMKLPRDYNRNFFVYDNTDDIFGNEIKKEELYEGTQKRFIYWVPIIQK